MNCNKTADITIKKVVNGGYGLGTRPDGKTVLARFGLPDETVTANVTGHRQNHDLATVTEVSDPHPGRIDPPCQYYGKCGGCDLQHANYPTQCSLKQDILADLLERSSSAVLKKQASRIRPTLPSTLEFGYRQRLRLKVGKNSRLGFNEYRSHKILPVKHCLLAPTQLNTCLQSLPDTDAFKTLAPIVEEVEILLNPAAGDVCLLLHLTRAPRPAERAAAVAITAEIDHVTRVYLKGTAFALSGPFPNLNQAGNCRLTMGAGLKPPLNLSWEVGGFSQVNYEQNKNLVALVLELAEISDLDRVLDLYCGMGNFSIPLARYCGWVHGIESQGSAIRSALHNSNRNGLLNTSFQKTDVASASADLYTAGEMFDLVICDPPRQGLGKEIQYIGGLTSGRIVYVSCDPATLCRDLGELCSAGFGITTIQPIDMFPQTHHIETLVLLVKDS